MQVDFEKTLDARICDRKYEEKFATFAQFESAVVSIFTDPNFEVRGSYAQFEKWITAAAEKHLEEIPDDFVKNLIPDLTP